ncbi:MAG: substrate-binding domain-containing protein [Terracidiphilus sp.]|nr:substrate-binding domain-containing protein [Terracidiphilus sp.]
MTTAKRLTLVALALAAGILGGCDRHSNKEVYYLVAANQQLPYWQTVAAGFNRAAAQFKVTAKVVGPDTYDPKAEVDAMQKAVAAKPSGILISVADAAMLQPEINAAIQDGIPVITVDSDATTSHRLFFIGTNNLEAGRVGGKRLLARLNGTANVAFFTLGGQPNVDERLKGFRDVLMTRPGIQIAAIIDTKSDPRIAFDQAQQMLALTGAKKIDAFVCLESACGKPVSDALQRADAKDRVLVAWDANPDTLQGIKAGLIDATIVQKPFTMGYFGLKALDEIFHAPQQKMDKEWAADPFSPYPAFVDTGTDLVDQSNVDQYIAAAAQAK